MASLIVNQGGGKDFSIHPAVQTAARCTRIIDLGTVEGTWEGKAKKQHKIVFGFESAELVGDDEGDFSGKPFLIIERFTASLSDKANMRKFLEAWRGRKFTKQELDAFDLKNVLKAPCYVSMVHTDPNAQGKVYSNVSSIMPLPKGMTMPDPAGEVIFFSLNPNEPFDAAGYEKLGDYYKKAIAESDEYKAFHAPKSRPPAGQHRPHPPGPADDDIPF